MRKLVVAGLFSILAGLVLHAESVDQSPFVVQYIDGSAQIQLRDQTSWKSLKLADPVPVDATVRLAQGAVIELVRGEAIIPVLEEGIYPMASLSSELEAMVSTLGPAGAFNIQTIHRTPTWDGWLLDWSEGGYSHEQMLQDEQNKASAISNKHVPIEGFEIDNLEFFHWGIRGGYARREPVRMYEEYKDAIDLGVRALVRGDFAAAVKQLRYAVTSAIFPEEERSASYLLAVAYAEAGSPARAWQIISRVNAARTDPAFGDILIRKAQILLSAFRYEDALATLQPLLEPLSRDEFGQAACLVAYYAYKGLHLDGEASEVRHKALTIAIDSVREEAGTR